MVEEARLALLNRVLGPYAAAWPTVPLVYGNDPFDWNNTPDVFTVLQIEFQGGDQIGAQAVPRTRVPGFVYAMVYVRQGMGDLLATRLLDWFATQLGYVTAGPVRLREPMFDGSTPMRGYVIYDFKVPFSTDQS